MNKSQISFLNNGITTKKQVDRLISVSENIKTVKNGTMVVMVLKQEDVNKLKIQSLSCLLQKFTDMFKDDDIKKYFIETNTSVQLLIKPCFLPKSFKLDFEVLEDITLSFMIHNSSYYRYCYFDFISKKLHNLKPITFQIDPFYKKEEIADNITDLYTTLVDEYMNINYFFDNPEKHKWLIKIQYRGRRSTKLKDSYTISDNNKSHTFRETLNGCHLEVRTPKENYKQSTYAIPINKKGEFMEL